MNAPRIPEANLPPQIPQPKPPSPEQVFRVTALHLALLSFAPNTKNARIQERYERIRDVAGDLLTVQGLNPLLQEIIKVCQDDKGRLQWPLLADMLEEASTILDWQSLQEGSGAGPIDETGNIVPRRRGNGVAPPS